jgi:hypothetical protein
MSTFFKTLVLALAGTILIFYGVGMLLADRWYVETTRTVPAPVTKVVPLLGNFATWADWSQMNANLGPETTREVTGQPGTVGHQITWRGAQGHARLVLAGVADNRLQYEFWRQAPGETAAVLRGHGSVRWEAVPGASADTTATEVTWRDDGTWDNLAGRWIGWFGALQERMRQIQTSSLTGLEAAVAK